MLFVCTLLVPSTSATINLHSNLLCGVVIKGQETYRLIAVSIVISFHEKPANFYGEKRSVVFVTGHLFTFLVVLSLICLLTKEILI